MGSGRPKQDADDRFWSKLRIGDGCWLWTAARIRGTYGRFKIDGKMIGAHVFSWTLHHGPVPEGLCVLHNCPDGDNPACVRPTHLFLGTHADNIADMYRKGRNVNPSGDEHWSRRRPELVARGDEAGARKHPESVARGIQLPNAVLTDELVVALRRDSTQMTLDELATKYGVGRSTAYAAITRRTWNHVR